MIPRPGVALTVRVERYVPPGVPLLWMKLRPIGRLALVGLTAATVVTAVLLGYLSNLSQGILGQEGQVFRQAATAMAPALASIGSRSALDADEYDEVDRVVATLMDGFRVRVKLWTLDGVVLYSDEPALKGQQFPDAVHRIQEAAANGMVASVTELGDPENAFESGYDELFEFYLPVPHPTTRAPVAVLEVYEDRRELAQASAQVAVASWSAMWASFSLLAVCLAVLIGSTVRVVARDEADRETRARELTELVEAADGLASSLEVDRLFAALEERVRSALGLTKFALVGAGADPGVGFAVRLRDGSHVVADRAHPALSGEDRRVILGCARSLDIALSNAALYEQVRHAALERGTLLQRVAIAHEEERRRLVGELHDSLASQLVRALYAVRRIGERETPGPAEASTDLATLEGIIAGSEELLRAFMERVRPPAIDELGLTAAVESAASRFAREAGLPVHLRVRGNVDRLGAEAGLTMVRAAEEALLNVQKHAGASTARVALIARWSWVTLIVEDDGRGLADAPSSAGGRGLGLSYIRERAEAYGGRVWLGSGQMGGARVVVHMPVGGA